MTEIVKKFITSLFHMHKEGLEICISWNYSNHVFDYEQMILKFKTYLSESSPFLSKKFSMSPLRWF